MVSRPVSVSRTLVSVSEGSGLVNIPGMMASNFYMHLIYTVIRCDNHCPVIIAVLFWIVYHVSTVTMNSTGTRDTGSFSMCCVKVKQVVPFSQHVKEGRRAATGFLGTPFFSKPVGFVTLALASSASLLYNHSLQRRPATNLSSPESDRLGWMRGN